MKLTAVAHLQMKIRMLRQLTSTETHHMMGNNQRHLGKTEEL